jgi:transposase
MAKLRKDVAVIEQILEMRNRGEGFRSIARCLGVSRNTVKKALREEQGKNSGVVSLKNDPLTSESKKWIEALDWQKLKGEREKGATFKILHKENCPPEVGYHQFWYELKKHVPDTPAVTMRLIHKPAEKTFFDFADGIPIVDRKTGEIQTTQLLCGVLPFSSYTYGEFVFSQKQPIFMAAIERAWAFFGGVTPYVTVDNLKSGVTRAHLYDPVVNPVFVEFSNHWGFAVLPARPYRPRDKAANECGIGVIQRNFYQEVRNRNFYSLAELNQCFREYLEKLNQEIMKDHGVSRADRFELERPALKPLAKTSYEPCEWKTSKVHADCHIQLENRFYSVPFIYIGRNVGVRITARLVEVFNDERVIIAAHARLTGRERASTQDGHYPEKKVGLTRFEVKYAKSQADRIGPHTRSVIDQLLDQDYPLKYLRRVQGILRLVQSGMVRVESLEYACKQGKVFQKLTYEYIKSTATFYQINGNRPVNVAPLREAAEVHLHQQ